MIKLLVSQNANDSGTTVTEATQEAKNLFKANNKPYILKDTVDGPLTKVVFSEHFIMVMRDADSNECMAKMSKLEKELYWDYINYQGIVNSIMFANPTWDDAQVDAEAKIQYEAGNIYIATELVVRTLSDWAYAEVLRFDKNSCYDTMHVWEA
jgi:hypothetical protein